MQIARDGQAEGMAISGQVFREVESCPLDTDGIGRVVFARPDSYSGRASAVQDLWSGMPDGDNSTSRFKTEVAPFLNHLSRSCCVGQK